MHADRLRSTHEPRTCPRLRRQNGEWHRAIGMPGCRELTSKAEFDELVAGDKVRSLAVLSAPRALWPRIRGRRILLRRLWSPATRVSYGSRCRPSWFALTSRPRGAARARRLLRNSSRWPGPMMTASSSRCVLCVAVGGGRGSSTSGLRGPSGSESQSSKRRHHSRLLTSRATRSG